MTNPHPILDELHRVREKLLEEAGGTLEGLVSKLQADQNSSGRRIWNEQQNTQTGKEDDNPAISGPDSAENSSQ